MADGVLDSEDDCEYTYNPEDSWLFGGDSDCENEPEFGFSPVKVPSPAVRKGRDPRRKSHCSKKGAGRKALHVVFPQLVETATAFVTQQSFAADARRRSSVGRACGTSMPALKRHLENEIPGLSISTTTCQRLMVAPDKKRKSAETYKNLIEAKVATKRNNEKSFHVDAHYCSCRVKYRMEFAAQFSDEVGIFSCDCMNKVHVGTMAVSRYHQISRYHMINDAPNYPDHDFPIGDGYLITPCGYMMMESTKTEPIKDELGRSHIYTSRTGPIHIVNRSQKFHKLTIQEHVNDLIPIVQEKCVAKGKTGIVLIVDGGPDWNDASWTVLVFLARLLKTVNLDFVCMTKYAPKNSALNPIEHGWSPLSRMLTSVRLNSTLEGETVPPNAQTGLSKEEIREKEAKVFDNAMKELNAFWDGQTFDGFPIRSSHHPCNMESRPFGDYDANHPIIANGSRTRCLENTQLYDEMRFAVQHSIKRPRELSVIKCEKSTCTFCASHPVRAVRSMAEIRKNRGIMLVPEESPAHPGHFKTYLELAASPDGMDRKDDMPSSAAKDLGKCPHCTHYMFSSKEDRKRHLNVFHF